MTSWFHSILVGRVVSLCCSDSLLGYSTREKKNIAPYVSEMELGVCRLGDGIGWATCFLRVFRDGGQSVSLGFGSCRASMGKLLGVSRPVFVSHYFLIFFCPMCALSARSDLDRLMM